VKDRTSKEPFLVGEKVAPSIHAAGLREYGISLIPGLGLADGTNGDVLVLAPAYSITKRDADLIVDRTAKAIEHVLGARRELKL